jgi:energy-coupling factor transporter ATP-binding protein EcfA2
VAHADPHRRGLRSYLTAAAGAIYLVGLAVLRSFVRRISRLDSGRRFLALLARTDPSREDDPAGIEPLPEDRRSALLAPPPEIVDDVARRELDRLRVLVEGGNGGVVAVLGERGGGKTTLLRRLADAYPESTRWIDCPTGGFEPFRDALLSAVGLTGSTDPREDLAPHLQAAGIRLLIVDDLQRLAQPAMGGLRDIDLFSALVSRAGEGVLCAVGLGCHAWSYISRASGDRIMMQEVMDLPAWTEIEIGALLDLRAKAADVRPDFRRLVLSRQLDDGVHASLEDRNRFGFYRVIWDLASGNPEVAVRLFADALGLHATGSVRVRLPDTPNSEAVNGSSSTIRIVLRVLVQTELASTDELVQSLRLTRAEVGNAVRFCLQRGWVEEIDGRYRLTWAWYRTITRVLDRQNLLAR